MPFTTTQTVSTAPRALPRTFFSSRDPSTSLPPPPPPQRYNSTYRSVLCLARPYFDDDAYSSPASTRWVDERDHCHHCKRQRRMNDVFPLPTVLCGREQLGNNRYHPCRLYSYSTLKEKHDIT